MDFLPLIKDDNRARVDTYVDRTDTPPIKFPEHSMDYLNPLLIEKRADVMIADEVSKAETP